MMQTLSLTVLSIAVGTFPLNCEAATITERYYDPQDMPLNRVIVNNPGYISAKPINGLNILVNNIVAKGESLVQFSPNYWSGYNWTGVDPVDRSTRSQLGLRRLNESLPSYGSTVIQKDRKTYGFQLNTFGTAALPNGAKHVSLQYRVDLNKAVWSNSSDHLCVSGQMNIASMFTGRAVNQAMVTLYFQKATHPFSGFNVNIMMFDSRKSEKGNDNIIIDSDVNNINEPIVITKMQSQGENGSKFSMPIPGYGNKLRKFESGSATAGIFDRGFCISKSNFSNALTEVTRVRASGGYTDKPSDYILRYALVGPEQYVGNGYGHIGFAVHSFYVYRLRE